MTLYITHFGITDIYPIALSAPMEKIMSRFINRSLSVEQLVKMYFLKKSGLSWEEVKEQLGFDGGLPSLWSYNAHIKKFLSYNKRPKFCSKIYWKAALEIKNKNLDDPRIPFVVDVTKEIKNNPVEEQQEESVPSFPIPVPQEKVVVEHSVQEKTGTDDRYTRLEKAFTDYQMSMVSFVQEEVAEQNRQVLSEKQELEKEIIHLKQENERLLQVLEEAKSPAMVNMIRKMFGKQPIQSYDKTQ